MGYTLKIYGAPGTGKTTRLLDILERELEEVQPHRIAYITHTVAANREAVERASAKVDTKGRELTYFKTIHAICFYELGVARQSVLQPEHYLEFGESIGVPFSRFNTRDIDVDGLPMGYASSRGNIILNAYFYAKANCVNVSDVQHMWPIDLSPSECKEIIEKYEDYKINSGMIDFSDMLDIYNSRGEPLPIDVMIIDEAQDLSKQQWEIVGKFKSLAQRIYIAGDDDQSIYGFLGADPHGFLNHEADEIEVLPITYRLKENVWKMAEGIISQVAKRQPKDIEPIHEQASIRRYGYGSLPVDYSEDTMVITPHNRQIAEISRRLEELGVPFSSKRSNYEDQIADVLTWIKLKSGSPVPARYAANLLRKIGDKDGSLEIRDKFRFDPELMISKNDLNLDFDKSWVHSVGTTIAHRKKNQIIFNIIKSNGIEALSNKPLIRLSTYHGSKGLEASHVILMTDIYEKAYTGFQENPDDERRLSYVGVTRAKDKLSIINPQSYMCMRSIC